MLKSQKICCCLPGVSGGFWRLSQVAEVTIFLFLLDALLNVSVFFLALYHFESPHAPMSQALYYSSLWLRIVVDLAMAGLGLLLRRHKYQWRRLFTYWTWASLSGASLLVIQMVLFAIGIRQRFFQAEEKNNGQERVRTTTIKANPRPDLQDI